MVRLAIALSTIVFVTVADPQGQSRGLAGSGADQSPYSLATTLLQALSLAASARDSLAETSSSTGNPIADSLNAIVVQRGAVSRLKEAIQLLDRFRTSPDLAVRSAAEDLSTVYEAVSERLLSGVTIWEKLAKTKTADDIAALVPESAKQAAEVQDAWRLLPVGVAGVTHALVDSQRLTDGKLSHLRLTRAERAKLIKEIGVLFPRVKASEKGGQVVDVCVNLFRGFLNQGWIASDER